MIFSPRRDEDRDLLTFPRDRDVRLETETTSLSDNLLGLDGNCQMVSTETEDGCGIVFFTPDAAYEQKPRLYASAVKNE